MFSLCRDHFITSRLKPQHVVLLVFIVVVGVVIYCDPSASLLEWAKVARVSPVMMFFLQSLLCAIPGVPAMPFYFICGFKFGFLRGLLVSFPAAVVSITLSFLVCRYALKPFLSKYAPARDVGILTVIGLRVSFVVPWNVLNITLAISSMPFTAYLISTLVGCGPSVALWVFLASVAPSLEDAASAVAAISPLLGVFGCVLLVLFAAFWLVVRQKKKYKVDDDPLLTADDSEVPPIADMQMQPLSDSHASECSHSLASHLV